MYLLVTYKSIVQEFGKDCEVQHKLLKSSLWCTDFRLNRYISFYIHLNLLQEVGSSCPYVFYMIGGGMEAEVGAPKFLESEVTQYFLNRTVMNMQCG